MSDWSNPLLPQNQTTLESAIATATETRISPDVIATLWDSENCQARLLPWLAWSLSVDEWVDTWDEATQRRVIAASIEIHRKKGTVAAVRAALISLGHTGRLIEWWQTDPRSAPHTFQAEVEIGNRGIDDAAATAIERQIIAVKPVRSHFTLRLVGRSDCLAHLGVATLSGDEVSIRPYQITYIEAQPPTVTAGIGLHAWGPTTIYPIQ